MELESFVPDAANAAFISDVMLRRSIRSLTSWAKSFLDKIASNFAMTFLSSANFASSFSMLLLVSASILRLATLLWKVSTPAAILTGIAYFVRYSEIAISIEGTPEYNSANDSLSPLDLASSIKALSANSVAGDKNLA